MSPPVGELQEIGWALRKEDAELRRRVEAFFHEQKATQATSLNQIWDRHFGVSLNRFETWLRPEVTRSDGDSPK